MNVPQVGDNTGGWWTSGSVSERRRAYGGIAYKAGIVVRKDGVRHKLSQTFDREAAARHWIKRREEELRKPGGLSKLERTRTVTLAQAIERYIAELTQIGKTKAQVLQALLLHKVARKECSDIGSKYLVDLARDLRLDRKPQTVANFMTHLSAGLCQKNARIMPFGARLARRSGKTPCLRGYSQAA